MARLFRIFPVVLFALLVLFAQKTVLAEKRIALLIGNSAYKFVAPLANPAHDVRLLAGTFRDLGFEVLERRDVGYIDLKKAIRDFTAKLNDNGPETVGFVYYAGHGLQVGGINYLVPVDAEIEKEADVALYSIDADALMQGLINVGNNLNVIVLDSCRNNPFKAASRGLSQGGLARMDAPKGSLIAYATSPGNVAEDGDSSNSPFSRALSRELRNPGNIEAVMKRVRQSVFGETEGRQLPWSSSSIIGEFCPAGCQGSPADVSSATSSVSDPAHRAWLTIKDSKNPRILRSFARKYPNSLYAEFARIKIDELKPRKKKTIRASTRLILSEMSELGQNENDEHGRYFVIMGSFPKADLARAEKRVRFLRDQGIKAHMIDTNNYPNLTDGLYAVVMGPYNRDYAIFKKVRAREAVADAYVKAGR